MLEQAYHKPFVAMPSEGIPSHFNPERWKALNPGNKRKRERVVEHSSYDHQSATGLLNQSLHESKVPAGSALRRAHNELEIAKKGLELESNVEKPVGPQAPYDKLQNTAHAEPVIIFATNSHERESKVLSVPSDVFAPTVVDLPREDLDTQDIGKARALMGNGKKPKKIPGITEPRDQTVEKRVFKAGPNLKENAKRLWLVRKNLPIWSHSVEIRNGLRNKDIMLLVGETGSGKSTQVPQMLINESWCKSGSVTATIKGVRQIVKVGGCIAITEPRRVAAISLARRVAEEMGTPLGSASPASKVGYSVRFDNSTSPNTRIKYLTEGMLLQEMLRDPWLREYSAVIVDEVHERGVNVDLVMGFLKNMNAGQNEGRGGLALKTVIMSATLNMDSLVNFFEGRESHELNGASWIDGKNDKPYDPENFEGEVESEWSGISSSDNEGHIAELQKANAESEIKIKKGSTATEAPRNGPEVMDAEDKIFQKQNSSSIATCHIEGRQYPVKVIYSPEPVQDFVDACLRTIFQIHYKEPMPGDVLVFLTGQETIESLENLVNEYALNMSIDVPKILVLPLFAALPQAAQQQVFQPAPPRTRKIILATNIAETSVTVSGVRFVIDCGKAKIKQFRSQIGLDSLLVKPISKSAATQRKGRAGREAPGQCYRLYTEKDFLSLEPSNTPEILRCDLAQAILTMKSRGVNDVINFPFLDSPPREALEKALIQLLQLQALKESGDISDIGMQMAKLPLSVSLARVLLAAAEPEMNCVLEVIDIISCLSVENIFLNLTSEEKKAEAEAARRELYRREGDHLTLLTTVQAYASERADRKAWAERHFVSHRAMQSVMVCELRRSSKVLLKVPRMFANSFESSVNTQSH